MNIPKNEYERTFTNSTCKKILLDRLGGNSELDIDIAQRYNSTLPRPESGYKMALEGEIYKAYIKSDGYEMDCGYIEGLKRALELLEGSGE